MCDTIAVVSPDRVLFAKNSDRDVNEAQFLQWCPATDHPAGQTLRCTWIEISQVAHTHAVLLSRPFWIWGAEMGANEHGLVIGNEAVFTRQPLEKTGLLGMDLLRLALERAQTAAAAVEVIVELLETHGQGGGAGYEDRGFSYHNSFLIADPSGAIVLETAGRKWATEQVTGARSISNCLSIPDFARRHSDFLYTAVAQGKKRRSITGALAARVTGAGDMMRILRSHNADSPYPVYHWLNGAMGAPCMHAGGLATGSQTTASWVADLSPDRITYWVTGTSTPCTALFKPVQVNQPADIGPEPTDRADSQSLWWRHERFHRQVMKNPAKYFPLFTPERDRIESQWLQNPPGSKEAFKSGDRLLEKWVQESCAKAEKDVRPLVARRYWSVRNNKAGLLIP